MGVTFPNESPEYRTARNKLLQREIALRREIEAVAAELRTLPGAGRFARTTSSTISMPNGASSRRSGCPNCSGRALIR